MIEFRSPIKRLRTARFGMYFSTSSVFVTFQLENCSRVTVSTEAGRFGSTARGATLSFAALFALTLTAGSVVSALAVSAWAGAAGDAGKAGGAGGRRESN